MLLGRGVQGLGVASLTGCGPISRPAAERQEVGQAAGGMGLRGVQLFKCEGADWRVQESRVLGPSVGSAAERRRICVCKILK